MIVTYNKRKLQKFKELERDSKFKTIDVEINTENVLEKLKQHEFEGKKLEDLPFGFNLKEKSIEVKSNGFWIKKVQQSIEEFSNVL